MSHNFEDLFLKLVRPEQEDTIYMTSRPGQGWGTKFLHKRPISWKLILRSAAMFQWGGSKYISKHLGIENGRKEAIGHLSYVFSVPRY